MRTLAKLTALAGFSLIAGPALLASNDLLDNTTFTVLFILGFVLVIASASDRVRATSRRETVAVD